MAELTMVRETLQSQGNFLSTSPSEETYSTLSHPEGLAYWHAANIPERHKCFKPEHSTSPLWNETFGTINKILGRGPIFSIMGQRGCGKTQLAVCLIRVACKSGMKSLYTKAIDVFIDLRESFKVEGVTESAIIRKYVSYGLLVVDAMENRGETEFENRLLNHIIDKRYDSMRDTVLISNQTEREFAGVLGPSILSRINETGGYVVCNWNSFRNKQ